MSEEDQFNVADLLRKFHRSFDDSLHSVPSAFLSGLTTPILKQIVNNLAFIDSPRYLLKLCIVDELWAKRIYDVIENYFENSPFSPKKSKRDVLENVEQKYEFSDSSGHSSETDYDDEKL